MNTFLKKKNGFSEIKKYVLRHESFLGREILANRITFEDKIYHEFN